MAITGKYVSVQYNGGLLPDIYTVGPMLLALGDPFKYHEERFRLCSQ